jgi:hypothetical protein
MSVRSLWAYVAEAAAALAGAMGVGRFVYTPILPLMTGQAGLTAEAGASVATANYVGYFAGSVAGTLIQCVGDSYDVEDRSQGRGRRHRHRVWLESRVED